jgi:hypothetical protein
MRLIASLLLSALVQSASPSYPPPYPREGTKALIDNERVQVWDVTWPKGVTPGMHRHLYDMTGIYYWPGDRLITATDGSKRDVSTPAGRIQWQLKGITHIEEAKSDDSLRAVMIELKGDGPSGKIVKAGGAPAIAMATMPLLDNERVTVWDYAAAPGQATRHAHPMDTVVVFTSERSARAVFVPAGTVHEAERVPAGTKATVFELK